MAILSGALNGAILAIILSSNALVLAQASGSGTTTRYWDCCKPACSWNNNLPISSPVKMCDKNQQPILDPEAASGCTGGPAFMCASQIPWAINDQLAYGFAAVNVGGQTDRDWCCSCYELTFTSGAASGKKMIVQASNTGSDVATNAFDLAIPGGSFGMFDGCQTQYNGQGNWGRQWGGVYSRADCDTFPDILKQGCYFRWDWMGGDDNPTADFTEVSCPKELTDLTGCIRNGQTPTGNSYLQPSPSPAAQLPADYLSYTGSSNNQTEGTGQGTGAGGAVAGSGGAGGTGGANGGASQGASSSTGGAEPSGTFSWSYSNSGAVYTPAPIPASGGSSDGAGGDDADCPSWAQGPMWNGQSVGNVPGHPACRKGKSKKVRRDAIQLDDMPSVYLEKEEIEMDGLPSLPKDFQARPAESAKEEPATPSSTAGGVVEVESSTPTINETTVSQPLPDLRRRNVLRFPEQPDSIKKREEMPAPNDVEKRDSGCPAWAQGPTWNGMSAGNVPGIAGCGGSGSSGGAGGNGGAAAGAAAASSSSSIPVASQSPAPGSGTGAGSQGNMTTDGLSTKPVGSEESFLATNGTEGADDTCDE